MTLGIERDVTNDEHWTDFAHQFLIRPDTTYLNHGSFGPPSQYVKLKKRQYSEALDSQPMDFFTRQLEPALAKTRQDLARFVGTPSTNLVLVENATFGMNVVADSIPLAGDDEVLINNHEYGAVHRIWHRKCLRANARLNVVKLPEKFESVEQIVDCLTANVSDKTRIVVVSHVTSATAIVMPVSKIVAAMKQRGIPVIVDGPHAPAQINLDIDALGCDFYTASCHKWLSAGLGSGFLFVDPKWHQIIEPQLKSWGRLLPAIPRRWDEEFTWSGTRDPSAYLSISDAIDFLTRQVGLELFRERSYHLASQVEDMLCEEFKSHPVADRERGWYASMAHIPLPLNHDFSSLQEMLWHEYKIEVPIICFEGKWYVRVSCHLYNNLKQIESLIFAIRKYLV